MYVVMMTKKGSPNVNFMILEVGVLMLRHGHISHKVKCIISLISSSQFPGIDQSNQVCSNDDQGRVYQNCKFHDPRGRGSCARAWTYKSYSENALFL